MLFRLSPPSWTSPSLLIPLAAALLLLVDGRAAHSEQAAPRVASVRIGIAGKLKVGSWTPIVVELPAPLADDASVVAVTTDFENNRVETPLERTSPTKLSGLIQVGRLEGRVAVIAREATAERLLADVAVLPEGMGEAASYRQNTEFWGVLGSSARFAAAAAEWTESVRTSRGRTAPAPAVAVTLDWNSLPDRVEAWDSLDVLVVGGDAYNIPVAKNELLRQWVERGGRIVLLLGSATGRYQQSPVAGWSPVRVEGVLNVTSLESVRARVEQSGLLRVGRSRTVPAARLPGPPDGALPGPAILAKPYGFGFVNAFAFDFEQPPLSTWENQTALLRQLMMPAASGPARMTSETDLSSIGVTDLASQLTSGLDRFEQVDRPSFRGVMLWTALWMVVLFPVDYLIVHKLLKRPHLTWITLPILITAATLMAARTARAGNSAELTVNQIDLLDYTPARSTARVRSWMTFYSGETARYDLKANSEVAGTAQLAWNAKPEEGLRGLYRQGGINFGAPEFRTSADHTQIEDLPIRLWSSYSLTAEASREQTGKAALFESSLTETEAGRLQGELQHNLPRPLSDWIVLYKNFVYHPVLQKGELRLGEWPAGAAWRPGVDGQSILVEGFLQGRRMMLVKGQGKDAKLDQVALEVTAYDALEFNPPRLLRMLSFHEAAKGAAYTGLSNFPLAKLDVSRLLDSGRYKGLDCAIVMGRLEAPLMNYEIDGASIKPAASWTFVRAVLPVKAP